MTGSYRRPMSSLIRPVILMYSCWSLHANSWRREHRTSRSRVGCGAAPSGPRPRCRWSPHEELSEVLVVFVVPEDQASFEPDDFLDYCAKHLAHYKVPAEVMVTDAIPRTGSGKRMRFKLREQLLH
jgi:hypothetical protein